MFEPTIKLILRVEENPGVKNMKILMLGWELPPHFVGGMGTVCYSLCEYLAKSGADIEFILPFEADYSDVPFMKVNPSYAGDVPSNITYEDLQKVNATAYGKVDISYEEAMRRGILSFDEIHDSYLHKVAKVSLLGEYDVIHAHDWLTMRAGILAKKLSGLPLIVHIHATEFDRSGADEDTWGNPTIHDIEYQGLQFADKIIAVSQFTKDILVRRYGINPEKIDVVHNSIDLTSPYLHKGSYNTDQYAGLRALKEYGYKIVLNIGRHTIQKGMVQLLESARLAIEKNPKLMFLLIGSGDQHLELIRRAADMGISSNVIFTGFQSGVRAREALKLADVFVLPSQSEPFGTTPLEAMGFGTPVIVSNQSGVSEMISTAFKVDFWDTQAIADRILAVAEHDSLAESMRDGGLHEISRMSYATCASKTMQTYSSVVGANA